MIVKELITKLGFKVNDSQLRVYNKKINNAKEAINKTVATIAKVSAAAAIAGGVVIAKIGKEALTMASDLEEVQNVVDKTFGSMAESVNEWSREALNAYGLSELQAKTMTGTLGAMFKATGFSESALTEMSTTLVGLAGDFASFYNMGQEEAFEKIRAGINGSTEPLQSLGIQMTQANLDAYALSQGLGKTVSKMSEMEKQQLRYNYLLSVTADQQGDFADGLETSWSNYKRILSANITQLGSDVFKQAVPIAIKFTKLLNEIVVGLKSWAALNTDRITAFWDKVMEKIKETVVRFYIAIGKIKRSTNNFEGLRNMVSGMAKIIDTVVKIFLKLAVIIFPFLDKILGIVPKLIVAFSAIKAGLAIFNGVNSIMNILGAMNPIVLAIIAGIIVLTVAIYAIVKNWDKVKAAFAKSAEWIKGLFTRLGSAIKSAWSKIGDTVSGWIGSMISGLVRFWNSIVSFFKTLWDSIKNIFFSFGDSIKNIFDPVIEGIKNGWGSLMDFFSGLWGKITAKFDDFKNGIAEKWEKIKSFFSFDWGKAPDVSTAIMGSTAGPSSSYISSPTNTEINSHPTINVAVPAGTSEEQARAISMQVEQAMNSTWEGIIGDARASVAVPEMRSY